MTDSTYLPWIAFVDPAVRLDECERAWREGRLSLVRVFPRPPAPKPSPIIVGEQPASRLVTVPASGLLLGANGKPLGVTP